MTEVVSDCLGLCQHITQTLEENQAVSFLLSIQELDINCWKSAKDHLPGVCTVNRQLKEGHIRDICQFFYSIDDSFDTTFLVRNLGLIPGLSKHSLELAQANYTTCVLNTTFENVARISSSHSSIETSRATSQPINSNIASPFHEIQQQQQQQQQNKRDYRSALKSGRTRNNNRTWYIGSNKSSNSGKEPQLHPVCLAIKSGYNETTASLTKEFNQVQYRNLVIELVSQTDSSTTFRAKFLISTALKEKWKEPSTWPSRIEVSLWRGNPKKELTPIDQRIYRKNIYVGNLSPSITKEQVVNNMKQIYSAEMEDNVIANIEALINNQGTAHTMNKSMCVMLTSHPGKTLSSVPLKLNCYHYSMRRSVRMWRGRPPWPDDHEMVKPQLQLDW